MATKTKPRPKNKPAADQPEPDGIDRAKAMKEKGWRNCPVTDLDLDEELAKNLRLAQVETIGQLSDKLMYGGLTYLTVSQRNDLEDQIEQVSADDEKPIEFERSVENREPDAIVCPGCGEPAKFIEVNDDRSVFGCSGACGWMGTERDAEAFRQSKAQTTAAEDKPIEHAKPAKPEPMTPEELDEYDRETNRLVVEAESQVGVAESDYENLKSEASDAKKRFDARQDDLRKLIRDRVENRGKRPVPPEPSLLDHIPKWREKPIDVLTIMRPEKCTCTHEQIVDCCDGAKCEVCEAEGATDLRSQLDNAGIFTLGELYDQVGPQHDQATGPAFGLPEDTIAALRKAIEDIIDAEAKAAAPPAKPELWREFPIERWKQFGLTEKDVEKLHSGEAKGGGGHPIITVGDLNRFVTPNPANPSYARGYADIKGIGTAGADRISEAETAFWKFWADGGEAAFVKERQPPADNPQTNLANAAADETPTEAA